MDTLKKFLLSVQVAAPVIGPVLLGLAVLVALYYIVTKLQSSIGAGTPDPGGAILPNASLLDGAINSTLEVGHSSLSYTDAAGVAVSNPITTLESNFGFNQTTTSPANNASSYSGAAAQSVSNPVSTAGTILGFNQT
jgi:hypothetical protein